MRRRDWLGIGLSAPSWAAAWPAGAVKLLVAYPPGGISDAVARWLAHEMERRLRTPVLVEHRPGAGGVAAMEALLQTPNDGHTLCYSAVSPLTIAPWLSGLRFDPERDVQPVAAVLHTPVLVLGTKSFGMSSMRDALAAGKAAPGAVRWATSGLGTVGHMVLEQVQAASGVHFTHVPYKGGGQQIVDALGNQFEMLSSNAAGQQIDLVRQGQLAALAVGAPNRLATLSEVPTFAELGMPRANLMSTFGLFARRGIAASRLHLLTHVINDLLQRPELLEHAARGGSLVGTGSHQDFERQIRDERRTAQTLLGRR